MTPPPHPLSATTLFSATGIIAVVTGGGTGLGLMITRALAANGATTVYIIGRRLAPLETAAHLHGTNGNIVPLACDVTDKPALAALVETIKQRSGYINLLVNNAGVLGRQFGASFPRPAPWGPGAAASGVSAEDAQKLLWADTPDDWARTFATNVAAPYFTSVAFLALLVAGKTSVPQGSQVVFVSSIGALHRAPVVNFQYNCSKAAVGHLAQMWAGNMVQWGVRANCIAPGMYPSEMTAGAGSAVEGVSSLQGRTYAVGEIPLERPGREEEMAGAILGLVGVGGAYLNGATVVTDGGRLAVMPGV
ncbi:hypothetical protein EDC01DRAFT_724125 [Geopyxis carbonaria]|nr:hypothetical protein EDC01DRAFT_724125 [Geopyxis carbonaria]